MTDYLKQLSDNHSQQTKTEIDDLQATSGLNGSADISKELSEGKDE